jgi:chaperonin GroES
MLTKIEQYTQSANIAEQLTDEELVKIGNDLMAQIKIDEMSRSDWEEDYKRWLKLAEQVVENKSYPWDGASNVKLPLLTLASIQFHARAYAALVAGRDLVKGKIIGKKSEEKKARAQRVGDFMSAQFLDLMEDWQDDTDRLLMVLPIVGLVYKKHYYSGLDGIAKSEFASALDVIVNYHAKEYKRARATHRITNDDNEMHEYKQGGYYRDIDIPKPGTVVRAGVLDTGQGQSPTGADDNLTPYELYESHCFLDLDEDGYREPYIVTLDRHTGIVLRIVARWERESDIKYSKNKILRIVPTIHFTPYKFLPDPESKTHAIGFGRLLGPTNDTANTLLNMLVDSGHMSSLQSGIISKGMRIKGGVLRFRPNEWKMIQSTGEDIRKNIFPLPAKEPSSVLYELLGLMINMGRDLTSVQDIMVGRNPGQNQPYVTTQEVIEQGLKVFNGIYKRVYRSMTHEFQSVYRINSLHLDGQTYDSIIDDPAGLVITEEGYLADFVVEGFDVVPTAQPDMVQENNKILRALALKQHLIDGAPLNVQAVTYRVLEAEGHENIEELMTVPEQKPSVDEMEFQLEVQKFDHTKRMDYANLQLNTLKIREQALRDRTAAIAQIRKVEIEQGKLDITKAQQILDELHAQRDDVIKQIEKETNFLMAQEELVQAKKANESTQEAE